MPTPSVRINTDPAQLATPATGGTFTVAIATCTSNLIAAVGDISAYLEEKNNEAANNVRGTVQGFVANATFGLQFLNVQGGGKQYRVIVNARYAVGATTASTGDELDPVTVPKVMAIPGPTEPEYAAKATAKKKRK